MPTYFSPRCPRGCTVERPRSQFRARSPPPATRGGGNARRWEREAVNAEWDFWNYDEAGGWAKGYRDALTRMWPVLEAAQGTRQALSEQPDRPPSLSLQLDVLIAVLAGFDA